MTHKRPSLQDRVTRLDNAAHRGRERSLPEIDLLVLHATASGRKQTAAGVIQYMNRDDHGPISYHYLIDRDGSILRMTPPTTVAYHAGDSAWPTPKPATPRNQKPNKGLSVNARSIGISFVNDNLNEPLTAKQLESGEWLCRTWIEKLGIKLTNIRAHFEVSPGRKSDPKLDMVAWRARLSEP